MAYVTRLGTWLIVAVTCTLLYALLWGAYTIATTVGETC